MSERIKTMMTRLPRFGSFRPGRRFAFRPRVESVEPRTLLATGGPLVVATLGDSLTDEYSFYGPRPLAGVALPSLPNFTTVGRNSARNWVLNLAATRSAEVTFGAYTTANQGEVRNQGFTGNWATSGATAAGFNLGGSGTTFAQEYTGFPNEFPGVVYQEQPGLFTQTSTNSGFEPADVDVVTILIGANDYLRGLADYAGSFGRNNVFDGPAGGLNLVNAGVENAINDAVTQIQQTLPGARIVLVTTPDITTTPAIQTLFQSISQLFPDLPRQMSASAAQLTTDLSAFAASKRIGLVNFTTLTQRLVASPTVGGITVNLAGAGPAVTDGFVGDGFHPGTIVQGVLAQAIIEQINAQYGSAVVTPLADGEIAQYAISSTPTVTLAAIEESAAPGTINLQAVVRSAPASVTAPTGTVTFQYYTPAAGNAPATFGPLLGTVPFNTAGVAALNISLTAAGAGPIIAVYDGDQSYTTQASRPLISNGGSIPDSPTTLVPTTIELTPVYSRNRGRTVVTLSVVVAGTGLSVVGSPGGTVALGVGPYRQVYLPVVNGRARVAYPLTRLRGQFLSAAYSGDAGFGPSGSRFVRINPYPFRVRAIDTTAAVNQAARQVKLTARQATPRLAALGNPIRVPSVAKTLPSVRK